MELKTSNGPQPLFVQIRRPASVSVVVLLVVQGICRSA